MIPAANDPKWEHLVGNLDKIAVSNLPTRMMFNRMKLRLCCNPTEPMRRQAITEIREYLTKNEAILQDDLKAIFSR